VLFTACGSTQVGKTGYPMPVCGYDLLDINAGLRGVAQWKNKSMIYYEYGSTVSDLSADDLKEGMQAALKKIGSRKKVLVVPPDYTRLPSRSGELTEYCWEYLGDRLTDILPALGTHTPMTPDQISHMFGQVPHDLFRVHDWRNDVVTLGTVPAEFVKEVSGGACDYTWPAQVNKMLVEGGFDLILSIGQVVPHEVVGMANYNKNLLVGTGGTEAIHKSHYIGAVYGMENMMGRVDTPVRRIFNYASEHFMQDLPVIYVLTVVGVNEAGEHQTYGLFVGDDTSVFDKAAKLSIQVNFQMLEQPIKKALVWLDPTEFKSTWLGNKSVYRTRMALADDAELIVLAPGLVEFGEDRQIDELIRKYGYFGTPHTLKMVEENEDLRNNLAAAAHLIHGSSEGRFNITYCPGKSENSLSQQEIEQVGFQYADIDEIKTKYSFDDLKDGYNTTADGEEVYYISSPALGLWAVKDRFEYL
jgi:nickel-dependent lactate racemase